MSLLDWLFVRVGRPRPGGGPRRVLHSAAGRAERGRERRRVPRLAGLGARVIIDGVEYDVADWTETSFRIRGYQGDVIDRQILHFRFLLVFREETWEWPGRGRVVRVTEDGELAVVFRRPQEPFRSRLRRVVAALRAETGPDEDSGGGSGP